MPALHGTGVERIVYEGNESHAQRLLPGGSQDRPLPAASPPKHDIEESLKLKKTLLFSVLAVVPAALLPLMAIGQVAPDRGPARDEQAEPSYKYEAFAGYGYTSLNTVNQSRSGLQGVDFSVTRDWGKYFGITADGAYYQYAVSTGNPGNPSVETVLFGPVFHANLYGPVGGFVHVLLGGEHLAGENATPNISFAGGFGGGLEYKLGPRLSLRTSGDDIAASFVQDPLHLGYSAHKHWGARASFGVVYRF